MAFLLMLTVEGYPDAWLCLEAHGEASFSDLDCFIRSNWFPQVKRPVQFFLPKKKASKQPEERGQANLDSKLSDWLEVKDRFAFQAGGRKTDPVVEIRVLGYLPTAIMHRPVDLAAFPLETEAPVEHQRARAAGR